MFNQHFRIQIAILSILVAMIGVLLYSPLFGPGINNDEISTEDLHFLEYQPNPQVNLKEGIESILPNPNLVDNYDLLVNFLTDFDENRLFDSRPASIFATYWVALSLKILNSESFVQKSDDIYTFLMDNFDSVSETFLDPINYSYYDSTLISGIKLANCPMTTEIIHEMAIIILGEQGKLANFSPEQVLRWRTRILANKNTDGGFGTQFAPNSSIVESYFACYALYSLNNFQSTFLSASQKLALQSFLEGRQRSNEWVSNYFGVFSDYSEDPNLGWEEYYISWLTFQIYDIAGLNTEPIADEFLNFMDNYDVYLPESQSFCGTVLNSFIPTMGYYYGTAIFGEILSIMEKTSEYPELGLAEQNILAHQNYVVNGYQEYNYFISCDSNQSPEPWIQYLILKYLSTSGNIILLTSIQADGLTHYLEDFFSENSGASYIHNSHASIKMLYEYYLLFSANEVTECLLDSSSMLNNIMEYRSISQDYFISNPNIVQNKDKPAYKFQKYAVGEYFNELYSNYLAFELLETFGLMDEFYLSVGMDYLNYESWISTKIDESLLFAPDIRSSYRSNDLESIFYGLRTQEILIEHDEEQSLENFYSSEILSEIYAFTESKLFVDGDECYVVGDNSFDDTVYALEIFRILGNSSELVTYSQKFTNYLVRCENESNLWEDDLKIAFIHAASYTGLNISDFGSFLKHHLIESVLEDFISSSEICFDEENLCWINTIHSYVDSYLYYQSNGLDYPSVPILYEFVCFNLFSIINIDNFYIVSENYAYLDYVLDDFIYETEILPDFNLSHPDWWGFDVYFNYRTIQFCINIVRPMHYLWDPLVISEEYDDNFLIEYSLNLPEVLFISSELAVLINNVENNETINFSVNISEEYLTSNRGRYIFTIPKTNLEINKSYQVFFEFNSTLIPNEQFQLDFIIPNNSSETNSNTTSDINSEPDNSDDSHEDPGYISPTRTTGSIIFVLLSGGGVGASIIAYRKKKQIEIEPLMV